MAHTLAADHSQPVAQTQAVAIHHYAVQCHSRLRILVPIDSLYATSYQWI